MLRTLRSRLLLSYVIIIGTVLLLVAIALLIISMSPATARLRILPAIQQLRTISISADRQITSTLRQGAARGEVEQLLDEIADAHDTRILLLQPESNTFIYDSEKGNSWTSTPPQNIERFPSLFPDLNPSLPVGRLRDATGQSWLVYGRRVTLPDMNRTLLLCATPETGGLAFFRYNFAQPLWQAGLAALLLSVFLAIFISRSVAKPLGRLTAASEAVAKGNYEQQVPLEGPEDVQRVAQSFNSMVARVKATQQAHRDFLANVSHDLKTPLTAIQGWSQALSDGTVSDAEKQMLAINIIHEEAERMTRMVQELLTLARIDSGQLQLEPQWVDLGDTLADVRRNLSWYATQKQVELTLEQGRAPLLWADPDRLMQIFTNLVENALTHTPEEGRVHVEVKPDGPEWISITIQDTGYGIPAEELSRIFERFYRVEKSRARTGGQQSFGLGLAIVRELVEAHGGTITVQSEAERGTRFTVRLPLNNNPTGKQPPTLSSDVDA